MINKEQLAYKNFNIPCIKLIVDNFHFKINNNTTWVINHNGETKVDIIKIKITIITTNTKVGNNNNNNNGTNLLEDINKITLIIVTDFDFINLNFLF